jgi:hypothetical protein
MYDNEKDVWIGSLNIQLWGSLTGLFRFSPLLPQQKVSIMNILSLYMQDHLIFSSIV